MILPTPRYVIGQIVYGVVKDHVREKWPCPDCRDTKRWTATSPAGETFAVDCPRCTGRLPSGINLPSLDHTVARASTRTYTIGTIRIDTGETSEPVHYMCEETGIGSGQVHRETDLYAAEGDATAAADLWNRERQVAIDGQPEELRSAAFAGRVLNAALLYAWRDDIYNAWSLANTLREAIEHVCATDDTCACNGITTLEEARDYLRDEAKPQSWRKDNPFGVLWTTVEDFLRHIDDPRIVVVGATADKLDALRVALKGSAFTPHACQHVAPTTQDATL